MVTGHTPNQYVAYTSPGTGTRWLPTGPLGSTSDGPGFIAAVGAGGSVVAAGSANPGKTSQQALLIKADTAGDVLPVSLTAIQGGFIPEEAVKSTAVAGNVQIAVGSADGYPAVWRRVSDGPWALVSSLAQVSADPDLAGLSAVTHGPRGWLAAGPGLVLTSADGTSWQARRSDHARPGRRVRRTGRQRAARLRDRRHGRRAGRRVLAGCLVVSGPDQLDQGARPERDERLEPGAGRRRRLVGLRVGRLARQPARGVDQSRRPDVDGRQPAAARPGASAGVIQQVAVRGSHVVALGQQTTAGGIQPLAERSGDGGLTWQLVPFSAPGPGTSFTALTAGAGGFTVAAQFGSSGGTTDAAVWTSADGTSWTRSPVSGLTGGGSHAVTALAASGAVVTGIDSVQAQASQQFIARRLPPG